MFQSATLKLTGWYLLILMVISCIFSVAIYNITSAEIDNRLQDFQSRFERFTTPDSRLDYQLPHYSEFRDRQSTKANGNLLLSLAYVNSVIFIVGGIGSYILARRTLRDIEDAHEAQSRFTSDASHELRTPLAVMKSEIEMILRDESASRSDLREILESNLEEVDKLSRLSRVLLQLSKIDHTDIELGKIQLRTIVNDVIKRQNQPSTRLHVIAAANLPYVCGNKESIEELCMILVENALKYSPPDSQVTIRLSKRSSKVCLEITNAGKGISPDDLPRIFDRFYRSDSSRTNGHQSGYGLGLSLAKKIVEIHHGDLTATSALNHATTFTVQLPIFSKTQTK